MRQLTRTPKARRLQAGLTLIELAVTITIVAILAAAGLPSYADYVENAKLREGANLIVTGTLLARSEAIKRNVTVTVRVDSQRLVVSQSDGTAVRSIELPATMQTTGFVATYDSTGRLAPFGTDIVVPVTSSHRPCDDDIRCPKVHLEAGGTVSLCKTGVCA